MILPDAFFTRAAKEQSVSHGGPPRTAIVLSIIVAVSLFLLPLILSKTGVTRFLFGTPQRDTRAQRSQRVVCLTPAALDLMPLTKYQAPHQPRVKALRISALLENDLQSCSICTEDFIDDDSLRPLPCGHRFHPRCIDPWLSRRSITCPLCRENVAVGLVALHSAPVRPRRVLALSRLWARRPRPRASRELPQLASIPSVQSEGPGTGIVPRPFHACVALPNTSRLQPIPEEEGAED